jgi:hypothetical protein
MSCFRYTGLPGGTRLDTRQTFTSFHLGSACRWSQSGLENRRERLAHMERPFRGGISQRRTRQAGAHRRHSGYAPPGNRRQAHESRPGPGSGRLSCGFGCQRAVRLSGSPERAFESRRLPFLRERRSFAACDTPFLPRFPDLRRRTPAFLRRVNSFTLRERAFAYHFLPFLARSTPFTGRSLPFASRSEPFADRFLLFRWPSDLFRLGKGLS